MIEVIRLIDVTRLEDLLPFTMGDYELGEWEEWGGVELNHDRTLRFTRDKKRPSILQIAVESSGLWIILSLLALLTIKLKHKRTMK